MKNIDYTIKRLQDQQQKVSLGDTQVWLDATYSYIEEYFKSYSSRTVEFRSLVADFRVTKVDKDICKSKGLEYIGECLLELKEQKEQETGIKSKKTEEEVLKIKPALDQVVISSELAFTEQQEEQTPAAALPFGLSTGLFWTLFAAAIIGSFSLGYLLG